MVDGTGMCGACRVTVGDQVKFACVDGPEFDGHLVNFDEAMERQRIYKTQEGRAMLRLKEAILITADADSAEVTNNGSKERYDEKGAGQRAGSEGTCD